MCVFVSIPSYNETFAQITSESILIRSHSTDVRSRYSYYTSLSFSFVLLPITQGVCKDKNPISEFEIKFSFKYKKFIVTCGDKEIINFYRVYYIKNKLCIII